MAQKLLVIIPCFNEAASLPTVLNELNEIKLPGYYELQAIIINDCSTDETKAVAQQHKVAVLDLPMNLGIGGAVQTGFKYAVDHDFDLAIQLDGDGQHPPAEIIKLLNYHEATSVNVIIGSRFIDRQGYQSSAARRIAIQFFYRLNRLLTGNSLYDSTSGFRLLDKKAFTLATENYPDDYPEPESLIIFAKARLTIKEVPVNMRARLGGTSSINRGESIFYFIKVTIGMLFSFIRN